MNNLHLLCCLLWRADTPNWYRFDVRQALCSWRIWNTRADINYHFLSPYKTFTYEYKRIKDIRGFFSNNFSKQILFVLILERFYFVWILYHCYLCLITLITHVSFRKCFFKLFEYWIQLKNKLSEETDLFGNH